MAVLVSAGSDPARAQTHDWRGPVVVTKVRVPYGDLDLTRDAGVDTLLSRVADAAARACGGRPALGVLMLEEARAYRACKAKAVSQAVAQLDAPLVKQRLAERSGGRVVRVAEARP
jgi:UrcA family protein